MVVCLDAEHGYCKDGTLPWNIPSEFEHFLGILCSFPPLLASCVMGRVTWERDGLPDEVRSRMRTIYILSRNIDQNDSMNRKENCNVVYMNKIQDVLEHIASTNVNVGVNEVKDSQLTKTLPHQLFVLGGGDCYKEVMMANMVEKVIMSKLPKSYQCTQFLKWLPSFLFRNMRWTSLVEYKEFAVETWEKERDFLFSSESVTEAHPDKICDVIADAVVDSYLQQDKWSKVACEVMAHENLIVVCGYSQSNGTVDEESVVRSVLQSVGYDDADKGLDYATVSITVHMHKSGSPEQRDLFLIPADDQAVLYGYATNEFSSDSMMPLPHFLACRLTLRLSYLYAHRQLISHPPISCTPDQVLSDLHSRNAVCEPSVNELDAINIHMHETGVCTTGVLSESEQKLANMLRPVGKAQVTVKYVAELCTNEELEAVQEGHNATVTTLAGAKKSKQLVEVVVLEAQHNHAVNLEELKTLLFEHVVKHSIPPELLTLPESGQPFIEDANNKKNSFKFGSAQIFINGDGEYTHGGFRGGGLTGRKQNVDTYGGWCKMGGGAFSGKEYRKMDRSGAYAARLVAKSLVAQGLCDKVTVGLAYAIGHAKPVMITVNSENTASQRSGYSDRDLEYIVSNNFDLSVGGIVQELQLQNPIYRATAAGGHFGRNEFSWEQPKRLTLTGFEP